MSHGGTGGDGDVDSCCVCQQTWCHRRDCGADRGESQGQWTERRCTTCAGGGRSRQLRGFVVGSAAYLGRWLKDGVAFVRSNEDLVAQKPVWLFSNGPLGTEATDAKGVDLRTAAEPRELPEFQEAIHPRGHRVF